MNTPKDRKYSREHEWIKSDGDGKGLVGITHFAQDQLGDVVYLDLPQIGTRLEHLAKLGEVESVKAVSDLFSPVSGAVIELNQEAIDNPELVNADPYGKGWLLRIEISDPSELDDLLTADQYDAFLNEGSH